MDADHPQRTKSCYTGPIVKKLMDNGENQNGFRRHFLKENVILVLTSVVLLRLLFGKSLYRLFQRLLTEQIDRRFSVSFV